MSDGRPNLVALRPEHDVIAVILADGAVVRLDDTGPSAARAGGRGAWTTGTIGGRDWTLWWERRRFGQEPATSARVSRSPVRVRVG